MADNYTFEEKSKALFNSLKKATPGRMEGVDYNKFSQLLINPDARRAMWTILSKDSNLVVPPFEEFDKFFSPDTPAVGAKKVAVPHKEPTPEEVKKAQEVSRLEGGEYVPGAGYVIPGMEIQAPRYKGTPEELAKVKLPQTPEEIAKAKGELAKLGPPPGIAVSKEQMEEESRRIKTEMDQLTRIALSFIPIAQVVPLEYDKIRTIERAVAKKDYVLAGINAGLGIANLLFAVGAVGGEPVAGMTYLSGALSEPTETVAERIIDNKHAAQIISNISTFAPALALGLVPAAIIGGTGLVATVASQYLEKNPNLSEDWKQTISELIGLGPIVVGGAVAKGVPKALKLAETVKTKIALRGLRTGESPSDAAAKILEATSSITTSPEEEAEIFTIAETPKEEEQINKIRKAAEARANRIRAQAAQTEAAAPSERAGKITPEQAEQMIKEGQKALRTAIEHQDVPKAVRKDTPDPERLRELYGFLRNLKFDNKGNLIYQGPPESAEKGWLWLADAIEQGKVAYPEGADPVTIIEATKRLVADEPTRTELTNKLNRIIGNRLTGSLPKQIIEAMKAAKTDEEWNHIYEMVARETPAFSEEELFGRVLKEVYFGEYAPVKDITALRAMENAREEVKAEAKAPEAKAEVPQGGVLPIPEKKPPVSKKKPSVSRKKPPVKVKLTYEPPEYKKGDEVIDVRGRKWTVVSYDPTQGVYHVKNEARRISEAYFPVSRFVAKHSPETEYMIRMRRILEIQKENPNISREEAAAIADAENVDRDWADVNRAMDETEKLVKEMVKEETPGRPSEEGEALSYAAKELSRMFGIQVIVGKEKVTRGGKGRGRPKKKITEEEAEAAKLAAFEDMRKEGIISEEGEPTSEVIKQVVRESSIEALDEANASVREGVENRLQQLRENPKKTFDRVKNATLKQAGGIVYTMLNTPEGRQVVEAVKANPEEGMKGLVDLLTTRFQDISPEAAKYLADIILKLDEPNAIKNINKIFDPKAVRKYMETGQAPAGLKPYFDNIINELNEIFKHALPSFIFPVDIRMIRYGVRLLQNGYVRFSEFRDALKRDYPMLFDKKVERIFKEAIKAYSQVVGQDKIRAPLDFLLDPASLVPSDHYLNMRIKHGDLHKRILKFFAKSPDGDKLIPEEEKRHGAIWKAVQLVKGWVNPIATKYESREANIVRDASARWLIRRHAIPTNIGGVTEAMLHKIIGNIPKIMKVDEKGYQHVATPKKEFLEAIERALPHIREKEVPKFFTPLDVFEYIHMFDNVPKELRALRNIYDIAMNKMRARGNALRKEAGDKPYPKYTDPFNVGGITAHRLVLGAEPDIEVVGSSPTALREYALEAYGVEKGIRYSTDLIANYVEELKYYYRDIADSMYKKDVRPLGVKTTEAAKQIRTEADALDHNREQLTKIMFPYIDKLAKAGLPSSGQHPAEIRELANKIEFPLMEWLDNIALKEDKVDRLVEAEKLKPELGFYMSKMKRNASELRRQAAVIDSQAKSPLAGMERVYSISDFRDLAFPAEVAKVLRRLAGHEETAKYSSLKTIADANALMTSSTLAGDFSNGFIQLLPHLVSHPYLWSKSMALGLEHFLKPDTWAKWIMKPENLRIVKNYPDIMLGTQEFYLGLHTTLVKGTPKTTLGKVFHAPIHLFEEVLTPFERHFAMSGNVMRIELAKAYEPLFVRHHKEGELGNFVNKMTMQYDTRLAGVPIWQRMVERALFATPGYLRASFNYIGMVLRGDIESVQALKGIISLMVGQAAFYYGLCKLTGQEPQLDPTDPITFMTFKLGGVRVGLGGVFYALFKTAMIAGMDVFGNKYKDAREKWVSTLQPIANFFMQRASPLVQMGMRTVSLASFIGEPFQNIGIMGGNLLIDSFTPIWTQSLLHPLFEYVTKTDNPIYNANPFVDAAANLLGLRSIPEDIFIHAADNAVKNHPEVFADDEILKDLKDARTWRELGQLDLKRHNYPRYMGGLTPAQKIFMGKARDNQDLPYLWNLYWYTRQVLAEQYRGRHGILLRGGEKSYWELQKAWEERLSRQYTPGQIARLKRGEPPTEEEAQELEETGEEEQ